MSLPLVSADRIRAQVGFEVLVEPVLRAFQDFSAGLGTNGVITMYPEENPALGDVLVKTATMKGHSVYVVKVSPWFALNGTLGQPQGGFLAVFDSRSGHTLALLDDQHYLSDIRTAAAGSVAARLLAPPRIRTAAVLGSGVQAFWQPQALYRERPFETLRIWARNREKAQAFQLRLKKALPEVELLVSDDLEGTVRWADVLLTATSSTQALVRGEWLHEGQHITAVGADDGLKCELDSSVLRRGRVFVDSAEASGSSGDVHRALQRNEYRLEDLAGELGEVAARKLPGRRSAGDITVAKLVGLGVQDLVAAEVTLSLLGLDRPDHRP